MPRNAPDIKVIVAAGTDIAGAIKAALPMQLNEFARRQGFVRTAVSMCIHGHQRHERVREALADELDVDRKWLDEHLDALMAARREGSDDDPPEGSDRKSDGGEAADSDAADTAGAAA